LDPTSNVFLAVVKRAEDGSLSVLVTFAIPEEATEDVSVPQLAPVKVAKPKRSRSPKTKATPQAETGAEPQPTSEPPVVQS
jgi:hypothetical protein